MTNIKQISKEIVAYTQNNIRDTQGCFDFAREIITKHLKEK